MIFVSSSTIRCTHKEGVIEDPAGVSQALFSRIGARNHDLVGSMKGRAQVPRG